MTEKQESNRRSRRELRELVIGAAIDLIRIEGLRAVSTTLTYQRVFDHLEESRGIRVTRASVHERIWPSQHEFQLAVLAEINPWNTASAESVLTPAIDVFERTDGLSPLYRMQQMTRVAARSTQEASEQDPAYYAWVGMTMMLAKDSSLNHEDASAIAASVRSANAEILARTSASIRTMGELLGVRPRRDLFPDEESGWILIVGLGAALSEGATVRTRFDLDELPDVVLNTGPEGEAQEWSAFAAGYWALLQTFLEVDPERHPTTADNP